MIIRTIIGEKMSSYIWKTTLIISGFLLLQKEGIRLAQAEMEIDFLKCCDLGTSWAAESLACEKFIGPVSGVPEIQQNICLEAVDICCKKAHRDKSCNEGKDDARNGLSCSKRNEVDNNRRECCESCKLGISTGTMNKNCAFKKFSLGEPWDSAFLECCQKASMNESTTTINKSTTKRFISTKKFITTPNSWITTDDYELFDTDTSMTSDVTSALNNLCQIMKGMLCSHICVPTRGSYYCDCPEAYTLLEDGKTCKRDTPTDRCKTDENLCEQHCKDNKDTIVCSCDSGYKLAKNNRTCELQTTERNTRMTTFAKATDPLLKCPLGYRYNATSEICDDIDECAENNSCGQEVCYNQPGGYICAKAPQPISRSSSTIGSVTSTTTNLNKNCTTGLRKGKNGECIDIDECKESFEVCSSNEDCTNTIGSYRCSCKVGFQRDNLTQACVDINECQIGANECLPTQRCDNTLGSYTCVRFLPCGTGYTLNAATEICEDDDECFLGTHDCSEGYYCKNTLGSYRCYRNPRGTQKYISSTTAATSFLSTALSMTSTTVKATRPVTKITTQTMGTTRSTTKLTTQTMRTTTPTTKLTTQTVRTTRPTTKFTTQTMRTTRPTTKLTTQTMRTTRPTTQTMAMNTTMRTTQTTRSTSLMTNHVTRPVSTISNRIRSCPSGFDTGSSGQCVDINECQRLSHACPNGRRCINTIGSYTCEFTSIICGNGYIYDPTKSRCVDVDECIEGIHECGEGQTCENRKGGYLCSCPPGHTIEGNKRCVDIDECSIYQGRICGSNSKCKNTIGSYHCACNAGFENVPGMPICQDIDECAKTPNLCQHVCINFWGGYKCACKPGFRLSTDNRTCSDVDECTEFKENNLCVGICENTPGSYTCKCPHGYRLGFDGRTCQDIDECAAGQVCRNPEELCQNTRGGFRCNKISCPSGYYQDKDRKNRCIRATKYCQFNDLKCIRSPSHYSYNFITFVSMIPMPSSRQLELFTMRGTYMPTSTIQFTMAFVEARAPPDVVRATESCFALRRPAPSQAVLVLTKSIQGPQEIQLELSMEIYNNNAFAGSAVARIFILVSQYEF